jgi:CheY-like chemotaxis protein
MAQGASLGEALWCRRVLVAEDDRALLELLTEYFELQGLEVVAVESGDAALRELAADPPPDLVVLDIKMPGVPGDEVLRRMKADPRLAAIPVAAITGLRRDAIDLLATPDEFLSKPFDIESLTAALQRLCASR